jgi:hypothetical protein
MIPYLIWIIFDPAPERGGRPKEWARNLFIWKYFARKPAVQPSFWITLTRRILPLQHREGQSPNGVTS